MSDDDEERPVDPHLLEYPEKVTFTGVSEESLKSVHVISLFVLAAGILIAVNSLPAGLLLLLVFLVIIFGFEFWMGKKSVKVLKITLYLREDPVQAVEGSYKIGEIATGALDTEMDNPEDLGFRPSPKHKLRVWSFATKEDKDIVAKRLLEYLPKDKHEE